MEYGKTKLIHMLSNVPREGWTYDKIKDLIDSLWREKVALRWSGFEFAGSPDSDMGIVNIPPRTFWIEPDESMFAFYQFRTKLTFHVKRVKQEIELETATGWQLIYFARNEETNVQELHLIHSPTLEEEREIYLFETIVAVVYRNHSSGNLVYFGDERHGSEWPSQVHWWAHRAFNGLRDHGLRITGIEIGDGSELAHAQFGITAGAMWAEDILHETEALATTTGLPVYYNTTAGHDWNFQSGVAFLSSGLVPSYNDTTLQSMADGYYVMSHVFFGNCRINPLFARMGTAQYATEGDAYRNARIELEELQEEMVQRTWLYIGSVLYHYSTEYTNGKRMRIVGEITPEQIADGIADDKVPFKKTGWTPAVQEQVLMTASDAQNKVTLTRLAKTGEHYVQGTRFEVPAPGYTFTMYNTGMKYLRRGLYHYTVNSVPFTNYENDTCLSGVMYWNARQGYFCYAGWRLHMWEMEAGTRGNIIKETGMELVEGLEVTANDSEGEEHTVLVSDGTIRLADITAEIHDGDGIFGMNLLPLEARRYYLHTYPDDGSASALADDVHEWEYGVAQPVENIALLSENNEVVVNAFAEGVWELTETADGDYSAMWLIACLDNTQPLKWITGAYASADLDEAKELNNAESLLAVMNHTMFIDYYVVIARVIIKNIDEEPWYELVEIKQYGDGEFDDETKDRHVIAAEYDDDLPMITLFRNMGLDPIEVLIKLYAEMSIEGDGSRLFPFALVNDQETPGALRVYATDSNGVKGWHALVLPAPDDPSAGSGGEGSDGSSGETIIPLIDNYVTDAEWDTNNNRLILYRNNDLPAIYVEIPTGGENTDEKVKYDAGDPTAGYLADKIIAGTNVTVEEGTGANENKLVISATGVGSSDPNIDIHILFEEADSMTYICPYAMKLLAESASASISSDASINDSFSQYDEIEITATTAGLITLTFEIL